MRLFIIIVSFLFSLQTLAAESVTGLWTTIDDETQTPKSVVYIYEYNNEIYGRIVKLFKNQDKKITAVQGNPLVLGSDILWGLTDAGKRFEGGKILDPNKGKIYTSEVWRKGDSLIVRGKIGPFGRNQIWLKNNDSSLTPTKPLTPRILKLK